MTGSDYQNLDVWKRSVDFVVEVYKLTKLVPNSEKYGIISQIQRAAVSIPSNIAEGYRKHSKDDFRRFLYIASGSAAELETQLIIVRRVYLLEVNKLLEDLTIIQKMISALIKKL